MNVIKQIHSSKFDHNLFVRFYFLIKIKIKEIKVNFL